MSPVESNSRTWQGPKLPSRAFPCLQSAFQGLTLVFGGLSRTIPWILFHYLISMILQADFVLWNWLCYIETKSLVLQLMLFSCKIEIKFNHHFLCIDHLFRWLVIKLFSNFLLNIPFFFFLRVFLLKPLWCLISWKPTVMLHTPSRTVLSKDIFLTRWFFSDLWIAWLMLVTEPSSALRSKHLCPNFLRNWASPHFINYLGFIYWDYLCLFSFKTV